MALTFGAMAGCANCWSSLSAATGGCMTGTGMRGCVHGSARALGVGAVCGLNTGTAPEGPGCVDHGFSSFS